MSEDDIKPRQPREVSLEDAIRLSKDARDAELAELRAENVKLRAELGKARSDWSVMDRVADKFCADWKLAVTRVQAAEADIARLTRERDEAHAEPMLARDQPCGCVICYCDGERCAGCGASTCERHKKVHTLLDDPGVVWTKHPLLLRAEKAERERDESRSDLRALADAARRYQRAEDWYGHVTARLDRPVDRAECEVAATELREAAAVLRNLLSRLAGKGGGSGVGKCGTCGGFERVCRCHGEPPNALCYELIPCPACKGGKDGAK